MFLNFLDALRTAGIPVGIKEHLVLLQALDAEVIERTPEEFYHLARTTESATSRFDSATTGK